MKLETRIAIEKKIVRRIVWTAIQHDYTVTVHDGSEEAVLVRSRDERAIMRACFSVDEEWLNLIAPDGRNMGHVYLVYGNDGYDVMSDWSMNLDCMLSGARELADQLEHKHG